MTKGLPGSGKSTWAKEQLKKGNFRRVNKDTLRIMLHDGKHSNSNETFVLMARDNLIRAFLSVGQSVIVDDTNLAPKHEKKLRELAHEYKARFEIQDFTDVPIETCIKNDLKRCEAVGEAVIRKMYKDFLAPKPVEQAWDHNKDTTIICDIDGTLALFGDRNPYDRNFIEDTVNNVVRSILMKYEDTFDIILLSGREGKFRQVTEEWLKKYKIPYTALHMRAEGDMRKDYIIKEELYNEYIKPHYNVSFVLDDRNQVVDLWRRLGLTCLQVAPGDF